ncbi:hypothetical protein M3Y94_00910400 [Aphelenchoides besseyi]|nr:hypothetical protein M3Y94_00910400 [Aphelenchoides besseyi]KAI6223255.1 Dehydrogenase/reductase SDR family member on chromosome X [Aphelenchoides besseyi]
MDQPEENWELLTYGGTLLIFTTVMFFIRRYIKGGQFNEKVSARDRVYLVTGANSGIGRQIVRELNERKGKVYMLCRSEERGIEAKRFLAMKYGCDSTRMLVRQCDLNSFASIRKFVREFEKEENHVDGLINNAGVMFLTKFGLTEDGNEVTLQSNHLGHFLLTELLLPKLEAAPLGGRIVNVTSKLHLNADGASVEKMNSKKHYSMYQAYARSKLAQVLHAVEMTKRLRKLNHATKVTINSCHPGCVNTELVRWYVYQRVIKTAFYPFVWFFMKTEQDGAQTPLYLALGKKVNGVSGLYFSDCHEALAHPLVHDATACQDLYNQSVVATKLVAEED